MIIVHHDILYFDDILLGNFRWCTLRMHALAVLAVLPLRLCWIQTLESLMAHVGTQWAVLRQLALNFERWVIASGTQITKSPDGKPAWNATRMLIRALEAQ